MQEFIRRLKLQQFLAFELLTSTLFISILGLAMPLFVIQVLNRYVAHGFSGTLVTLTSGVLLATALQFILRIIRTRIAVTVSTEPDRQLARQVQTVLARGNSLQLGSIPKSNIHETISGLNIIQGAYNAPSINAVLDAPFSLLFLLAVYLLSPVLALIALAGIVASLGGGWLGLILSRKAIQMQQQMQTSHRGLVMSATNNIETVRAFQGKGFLQDIWEKQVARIAILHQRVANTQEFSQSLLLTLNIVMSVFLYAVGAVLVVKGELTAGSLIGANILASRAFGAMTKFVQIGYLISKASMAFKELEKFFQLPLEAEKGSSLSQYDGSLQFTDLGYTYPDEGTPLFESFNLQLKPGRMIVVVGYNGSGKTTLIRVIVGLLMPSRGSVLAEGMDLRQMDPAWWRRQIMYMPQEPSFLNTTIQHNITLPNPDIAEERLQELLDASDLRNYLDRSPKGLDTRIIENGANLPIGIRRRIALARALSSNGRIVVFDEPTAGLDVRGCQAVYKVLNDCIQQDKTMIVVTRDPRILRSATLVVNLGRKPVPQVNRPQAGGGPRQQQPQNLEGGYKSH